MKKQITTKIKPLDVAAYIVELSNKIGEPVTNMKLQKLIYYVYAWYAVEKGEKLFDEKIYAWKYGPVIHSVYDTYHKYGADIIKEVEDGNTKNLDRFTRDLIEEIFDVYGNKTAIELMRLAHSEAPWRDTFNPSNQNIPISFKKIAAYYKARKEVAEKIDGEN